MSNLSIPKVKKTVVINMVVNRMDAIVAAIYAQLILPQVF
jgi:hypothetical protein